MPLQGQDRADEQALPGRAVGRLSDLGWGGRLRALAGAGRPRRRAARPTSPAPWSRCSSRGRTATTRGPRGRSPWSRSAPAAGPRSCRSLAEHIATVGRLPLLGEVLPTAGAPPSGGGARGNSAQRVRALHGAFAVPADLAAAVAALDGPVLLVDDLVDSGWTMTMAARELRVAGAPAVLPLALAVAG